MQHFNNVSRVLMCILFMVIYPFFISSQDCPSSLPKFESQAAIDQFLIDYPNCKELALLDIIGEDITNLNGFQNLERVNGFLRVSDCPRLKSLQGLDNIVRAESIWIRNNDSLHMSGFFPKLETIAGYLKFDRNPALITIDGFPALDSIYEEVSITNHDILRSVKEFDQVKHIGGYVWIKFNEKLDTISAFSQVDEVGQQVEITFNDSLRVLRGFDEVKKIGGNLSLSYNERLVSIDAFEKLESCRDELSINGNDELTDIHALDGLNMEAVNTLEIKFNGKLETCNYGFICDFLDRDDVTIDIGFNGDDCDSREIIQAACLASSSDEVIDNSIMIYPNPASDFINIEHSDNQALTAELYDITGRRLGIHKVGNTTYDISTINQAGIYTLLVKMDHQVTARRIMINR